MSCSCGKNPCCCNRKRFRGNVDIKQIPGPKGEQGIQGEQGPAGADGAPGAPGGLSYEWWSGQIADESIAEIEAVIPGSSHVIAGGNGNYQIHVDASVKCQPNETVTARLYVNGVAVVDSDFTATDSTISGLGGGAIAMNWRGNILNGQTVEVRMFTTNIGAWPTPAAMTRLFILINKEA